MAYRGNQLSFGSDAKEIQEYPIHKLGGRKKKYYNKNERQFANLRLQLENAGLMKLSLLKRK